MLLESLKAKGDVGVGIDFDALSAVPVAGDEIDRRRFVAHRAPFLRAADPVAGPFDVDSIVEAHRAAEPESIALEPDEGLCGAVAPSCSVPRRARRIVP
jgi:hypothetical protein